MARHYYRALELNHRNTYYYTDSTNALCWILSSAKDLKVYTQRRVTRDLSTVEVAASTLALGTSTIQQGRLQIQEIREQGMTCHATVLRGSKDRSTVLPRDRRSLLARKTGQPPQCQSTVERGQTGTQSHDENANEARKHPRPTSLDVDSLPAEVIPLRN